MKSDPLAARKKTHINLEGVGKVNEHMLRLLLPTGNVQAGGDDVRRPPALHEVLLDRDGEKAMGGINEVRSQAKTGGNVLDTPPPVGQCGLTRVTGEAVPTPSEAAGPAAGRGAREGLGRRG